MKAVIIGRNGQVSWELQQATPAKVELLVLGSSDTDITNLEQLQAVVWKFNPDVIINASAYTAVDKAETEKEQAYFINEKAVANLALVAKACQARFIHISTDFVFDGEKNSAYLTSDKPNPKSVYGASKLAGEKAIAELYPDNSTTVRTSWVYSRHGNNFVKTMLRLMSEKEELNVVADQIGCPTYAKDLAEFLWLLAEEENLEAVYHWSDLGVASWYDFAVEIQRLALDSEILPKEISINPIKSIQYPTPAKRPKISLLDCNESLNLKHGKHWSENLTLMLKKL